MASLESILRAALKLNDIRNKSPFIHDEIQKTGHPLPEIVDFVQEKLDDPDQDCWLGDELSLFINSKITKKDRLTLKLNPNGYKSGFKMRLLGYGLPRGRLTIIGNAGYSTGYRQQGGALIIKGNAGESLCAKKTCGLTVVKGNAERFAGQEQSGGTLVVKGNTGYDTGWKMKGGSLIIKKNAWKRTGFLMSGGRLVVKGNT